MKKLILTASFIIVASFIQQKAADEFKLRKDPVLEVVKQLDSLSSKNALRVRTFMKTSVDEK